MSRTFFHGVDALTALFLRFSVRPIWLTYSQDYENAKTKSDLIVLQAAFIRAACESLDCLNLCKTEVQTALERVHKQKTDDLDPSWTIPPSEVKSWSKSMGVRIRTILKHVQEARWKEKSGLPPPWLKLLRLPKLGDEDPSTATKEDEDLPEEKAKAAGARAKGAKEDKKAKKTEEPKSTPPTAKGAAEKKKKTLPPTTPSYHFGFDRPSVIRMRLAGWGVGGGVQEVGYADTEINI